MAQIRWWITLIAGLFAECVGLALIVTYVFEAIIKRTGDPDQSLLFWYLPILFIGILISIAGTGMLLLGYKRLKQNRAET